jgi:hypothetical protein
MPYQAWSAEDFTLKRLSDLPEPAGLIHVAVEKVAEYWSETVHIHQKSVMSLNRIERMKLDLTLAVSKSVSNLLLMLNRE